MDFPTQVSRSGGRPSMDQVLQSGGKITEYHKHANDDYYVVHVTTPQREIFNFSNVRPDHLEKYLKSAQPPTYRGKEEAHRPTHVTLEELMDRGGKIVSFHPTRSGYFSVNVKVPESDGTTNVYVFTNISRDKFERYRSRESVYHGPEEFHPPATEKYPSPQTSPGKEQSQEMMRRRFEESMRNGGEIVGKEQFRTFSVHVRTADGNIEHYGNISQGILDRYQDEQRLEQNFRYKRGSNPRRHNRGDTFENVMNRGDSVIVDICPHEFYSIHVRKRDGNIEAFSHLSKERVEAMGI